MCEIRVCKMGSNAASDIYCRMQDNKMRRVPLGLGIFSRDSLPGHWKIIFALCDVLCRQPNASWIPLLDACQIDLNRTARFWQLQQKKKRIQFPWPSHGCRITSRPELAVKKKYAASRIRNRILMTRRPNVFFCGRLKQILCARQLNWESGTDFYTD